MLVLNYGFIVYMQIMGKRALKKHKFDLIEDLYNQTPLDSFKNLWAFLMIFKNEIIIFMNESLLMFMLGGIMSFFGFFLDAFLIWHTWLIYINRTQYELIKIPQKEHAINN